MVFTLGYCFQGPFLVKRAEKNRQNVMNKQINQKCLTYKVNKRNTNKVHIRADDKNKIHLTSVNDAYLLVLGREIEILGSGTDRIPSFSFVLCP